MRLLIAAAILALPAIAMAQQPTAEQFQSYRQSMANKIGNMADASAICEAGSATLAAQNKQLAAQVADLKKQLDAAHKAPADTRSP